MGIFGNFFKRDWYTVDSLDARWTDILSGERDYCFFEIQYSPSRNKTRLKCKGFKPKKHAYYSVALGKKAEIDRQILKDGFLKEDG